MEDQLRLKKQLEQHLEDLPLLPAAIAALISLSPEHDDYFEQVLHTLEAEPTATSRILGHANSALYAGLTPVATLRAALSRIGTHATTNWLLSMTMIRVFVPRRDWELGLWRHAVQVAVAARELAVWARDPEVPRELAFTCGLLHDIGRFIMFQEDPERLRAIEEDGWDGFEGLMEAEIKICGLTHAQLGGLACKKWSLPNVICGVVAAHHNHRNPNPAGPATKLTAVVQLADIALFPSLRPGTQRLEEQTDHELECKVLHVLPSIIQISCDELRELLRRARTQGDAMLEALGLPVEEAY